MSLKRFLQYGLAVFFIFIISLGVRRAYPIAQVGTGYYAKMLCSGVFVARRQAQDVIKHDILADQTPILSYFTAKVDDARRITEVSFKGLATQTAVYRDGLGCALAIGKTEDELRAMSVDVTAMRPESRPDELWPEGERVDTSVMGNDVDQARLKAALDQAFAEPRPEAPKRTRAVVVVHRGRIIAERYAPGFTAQTPQLGWSMSKSVTNALVGAVVARGKLSVTQDTLLPEWSKPGDPRSKITLDQLLRMKSGLEFSEAYGEQLSDVRVMLFLKGDKARFAASKPLAHPPGQHWHYSSGTTNIIARILRGVATPDEKAYLAMPYRLLFAPLGMNTAIFEPDAAGTFVGSSYVYASARDWARLGLLYLQDGVWQGQRILPEGWVDYSVKPTEVSKGEYGAHIWLKAPSAKTASDAARTAEIPEDDFYFLGHDGQMVAVIPSRETVIVRLGQSRLRGAFDHTALIKSILAALPE